uniref:Retrotransposon Orf1 n=1 Tax=Tanacetum cinerariifolium TaxID=118510 RepID=A0A6L2LKS5_TANCI|nr:retrotransposon Orf1 [Tanacetum cinerariifolium]
MTMYSLPEKCISNDNEGRMTERNFAEVQGAFLVKIRDNTFNGEIEEHVFEHINKFLEVVGLIKINRVSQDRFRLGIFPILLVGAAGKWFKKDCIGSVTTWDNLVEKFVRKFYQLSDHNDEIEEDGDLEDITDIFKIEGNMFDFETPLCEAFNDFNYILKINKDLFTFDIQGTGTYEEYELNNPVIRDLEEPWLDNEKINANEVSPFTRLESYGHRPYVNIKTERAHDPYLEVNNIFGRNYNTSNAQDNQGHEERRDDPTLELPVCKIRRFEMMKYSFNADEEYIAITESEYLNHSKDSLNAYRELLHTPYGVLNPSGYDVWMRLDVISLQSVEERLMHYKKIEVVFTEKINALNLEVKLRDKVLAEYTTNLEKAEKDRDELKLTLKKLQNSSKSLNTLLNSQVSDKSKADLGYKELIPESFVNSSELLEKQDNRSDKGYHKVPLPLTGNYMPLKRDLRLIDEHFESEFVDVSNVLSSDVTTVKAVDANHKGVSNTVEPKPVRMNKFSPPIIEDWHSDDESEEEISPTVEVKIVKPSIEKIKSGKTAREIVKNEESHKPHKHYPRGNQRNWNNLISYRLGSNFELKNKACYECGNSEHLIKDCYVHKKQVKNQKMEKPVWNNARRMNHQNTTRMTHPNPKRNMIPQSVLMRSVLKLLNTIRSVNTAYPKRSMNSARSKTNVYHTTHSSDKRPFNRKTSFKNSKLNNRVNTIGVNQVNTSKGKVVVNAVKGNGFNAVKASAC